jgi:serine/threonine-protein kinase RsbW
MREDALPQNAVQLDIPASLKYLHVLGACLASTIACAQNIIDPEIVTYNAQLALHEVCANIMLHAYARNPEDGRIQALFVLNPLSNDLIIELLDNGAPFDESSVKEPDLEQGQIHGYGLFLARNLMDTVKYQRQLDKNHWLLTKHL